MIPYQEITVDLVPAASTPQIRLNASQYDNGRPIKALMKYNGTNYNLAAGVTARILVRKPSGKVVIDDAQVSTGTNAVIFNLITQMTAEYGQVLMELSLTGENQEPIGTANWLMFVEPSPASGSPSDTWIKDLDAAVEQAVEAAEAADQDALDSEAWAVGERGGEPVTDVDPTYHNNSKYYSEQSDLSAQASAGSAGEAAGYVSDAQGYAGQASGYADDASRYAGQASGYADNASASAGEASGSATEAAGSARDAAGSALDAAGYSTAAGRSALDAADSAGAAAGSANSASGSASSASANALKSEGFAVGEQDGTPVASGSPYYHNNAEYYAGEASGSAASASDSAGAASGSASTASAQALKSEGYAVGTQDGVPVASGSPYYENNSKYYADEAAAVAASIPEDYSELSDDVADLKSSFEAFPEGTYPDMTVGGVMSEADATEDQTPYTFRASGGGVAVGNREQDTLVGGTIAWNQLVTASARSNEVNDVTFTQTADGKFTVSGTPSANAGWTISNPTLVNGHAYLVLGLGSVAPGVSVRLVKNSSADLVTFNTDGVKKITLDGTETSTGIRLVVFLSGGAVDATIYPQVIDLTQMFGATIADYIYALETAHAGDGVAWFKRLFPADYYPYNAGTLLSVNASAHQMVGFNQWDEVWEVGSLSSSNGANTGATNDIRSKNYIPALPRTTYYIKAPTTAIFIICCYDANQNFIKYVLYNYGNRTFVTSDDNIRYIRFGTTSSSYGNVYHDDICINLSGSRNGQYEPYTAHTYPLDSTIKLQGMFKLDSANRLYADGDTYPSSGQVRRRYVLVDLGTLDWNTSGDIFYSITSPLFGNGGTAKVGGGVVCPIYTNAMVYITNLTDMRICVENTQATPVLRTSDSRYTDANAYKTAMSGVMAVVELYEPTTEQADPFTEWQSVDASGTEAYIVTEQSGVAVPVGHVTRYPTDIVSKVDGLPGDFSTLIAVTEQGFTASRAYSVNDFLIVRNQLYKVTSNISNGGTITPGTNVTATTIGEVLTALLNA